MHHHPSLLKQFNFSKLVVHPSVITPTNFCGKEKSPGVARCKWWLRGALPLSLATIGLADLSCFRRVGRACSPIRMSAPSLLNTCCYTSSCVQLFFWQDSANIWISFWRAGILAVFLSLKKRLERLCDQTYWRWCRFSITGWLLFVVNAQNTLVGPVGPFQSTLILTVFTPNRRFLAMSEVGINDCNCN